MCFSAEASLLPFVTGLIVAGLCISIGGADNKLTGYFLGFVSLMQAVEYALWTHLECDNYNKIVSSLGMLLNHLQPIVLGILILLLNTNEQHRTTVIILIAMYVIVIVPYSAQFIYTDKCTVKTVPNNHLQWKWNILNQNTFAYTVQKIVTICYNFPLALE